jgi:hypothetical protein
LVTGGRAVRLPGDINPANGRPSAPIIHVFAASRLRTQIRDDLVRPSSSSISSGWRGPIQSSWPTIRALVAWSRSTPADTSPFPTTPPSLFADPASAPAGLTDWDRSYLTALYEHDQLRINRNSQVRAVAEAVARDRRRRAGRSG